MMCGQYTALVSNCSAVLLFMAAVLCIACGADTGPKSRITFSAGSERALEPLEHVLST